MFNVENDIAYISGSRGIYDDKIANPSTRYGRNAVSNYRSYVDAFSDFKIVEFPDINGLSQLDEDKFESKMQELDSAIEELDENLSKVPPATFEYRYSKTQEDGSIDRLSLLGASYEELGGESIKTKQLTKMLQGQFQQESVLKQILNNVLAFFTGRPTAKINFHPVRMSAKPLDINKDGKIDIAEYSTCILVSDKLSDGKIDGVVNNEGEDRSLAYANKRNKKVASRQFKQLYQAFNLEEAKQEFLKDSNNLELIG